MLKIAHALENELNILSRLLQNEHFAAELVAAFNTAEHHGNLIRQATGEMVSRKFREEKIAVSIAPFYALVCGIQALQSNPHDRFFDGLERLLNNSLNAGETLLLNRFANAAWKSGQPFRDFTRIKRYNFISAALLSDEEVSKDYNQLYAAAEQLYPILLPLKDAGNLQQLQKLQQLLGDAAFAEQMAMHIDAAYYAALQQTPPAFLLAGEENKQLSKPIVSEQMALTLSGFYALECGLSYFASTEKLLPSGLLQSIADGSLPIQQQIIFERLAHTTDMASQVFLGLQVISHSPFCILDLLERKTLLCYNNNMQILARQLQKYL